MSCDRAGILNAAMFFCICPHPSTDYKSADYKWCSQLPPRFKTAAMIVPTSAKGLGLQEGKEAFSAVKASIVMLAIN
jgi:hypothetical protein